MAKTRILTSFGKYSDAELEQKAELIADSMTDNESFPNPMPSLTELNATIAFFNMAVTKAKEGDTIEKLERDAKRELLINQLDKIALYVQMIGDENDIVLASSGFSLSKNPTPVGILEKPRNFAVKAENAGMIKLSLKIIHGAKSYQYEYKKTTDDQWMVMVHTQANLLLTGLQSGQQYLFRVAGVGTSQERVYSDVLSSFVL